MSETTNAIQIDQIAAETLSVPIIGTAPLIVHRFPEKAKKQMLDAMQGRKSPKEPKDPQAEYESSFHRLKDGTFGFPAIGFKAATVGAARFYGKNQVTMTGLRQFIFFRGEPGQDGMALVRIIGEARMREDVVRVNRGGSDLRYRGEFPEWSAGVWLGVVGNGLVEFGTARRRMARQVRSGIIRSGASRYRYGRFWLGPAGQVWRGWSWLGPAWRSWAELGRVRLNGLEGGEQEVRLPLPYHRFDFNS